MHAQMNARVPAGGVHFGPGDSSDGRHPTSSFFLHSRHPLSTSGLGSASELSANPANNPQSNYRPLSTQEPLRGYVAIPSENRIFQPYAFASAPSLNRHHTLASTNLQPRVQHETSSNLIANKRQQAAWLAPISTSLQRSGPQHPSSAPSTLPEQRRKNPAKIKSVDSHADIHSAACILSNASLKRKHVSSVPAIFQYTDASFSRPLAPLRSHSTTRMEIRTEVSKPAPTMLYTPATSPKLPRLHILPVSTSATSTSSYTPLVSTPATPTLPSQPCTVARSSKDTLRRRESVSLLSSAPPLMYSPPPQTATVSAQTASAQTASAQTASAQTASDPKALFRAMLSHETRRRRLSVVQYLSTAYDPCELLDCDSDCSDVEHDDISSLPTPREESLPFPAATCWPGPPPLLPSQPLHCHPAPPRAESADSSSYPASSSSSNTSSVINTSSDPSPAGVAPPPPSILALPPHIDLLHLHSDTSNAPPILWQKGGPLSLDASTPDFHQLTPEEATLCRTLRLYPSQYVTIKRTVLAGTYTRAAFKKKEMRAWFPIDVNKINKIHDWFLALGWIPRAEEEWAGRREWLLAQMRGEE
ncbi:hypothetical protein BC830DRAFT_1118598 [Chytriomyces sp. MP71]|nr:hypothetical protein BC830DRAFT_1118598 [Chytriomyces sp. MP71]